jgi:hypothetical protein
MAYLVEHEVKSARLFSTICACNIFNLWPAVICNSHQPIFTRPHGWPPANIEEPTITSTLEQFDTAKPAGASHTWGTSTPLGPRSAQASISAPPLLAESATWLNADDIKFDFDEAGRIIYLYSSGGEHRVAAVDAWEQRSYCTKYNGRSASSTLERTANSSCHRSLVELLCKNTRAKAKSKANKRLNGIEMWLSRYHSILWASICILSALAWSWRIAAIAV